MKHSRIAQSILYIIVAASMMYYYSVILTLPFTIVEAVILAGLSLPVSLGACSFCRGPRQFTRALIEHTKRTLARISILFVKVYGTLMVVLFRFGKLFLWLLLAVVYGVSPIDVIPDILIGPGQVDDFVVFLVAMWAGMTGGKSAIKESVNETIENLNNATKITTKFP